MATYFKNNSKRHVTVMGVGVVPNGIGLLEDDAAAKAHKGFQAALKDKSLSVSTKKEYDAFTDPAAVKAAAEQAAAEKEANGKKEGE